MRDRQLMPLGLLVILLSAILVPSAGATHNLHQEGGSWEPVSEEPLQETGFIPADEGQRDALRTLNDVGATVFGTVSPVIGPAVSDGSNATGISLLADGVGPDGRHGGFGPWRPLGDAGWEVVPDAARAGNAGFSIGNASDGYAVPARALLLSPEVDMRTASPDSRFAHLLGELEDMMRSAGLGSVYDGAVRPTLEHVNGTVRSADFVHFAAFDLRYNVGDGRDGLQIWAFESRPDTMPETCDSDSACTVLLPDGGYDRDVEAFGSPAFTGSSHGWRSVAVDVTRFAQGSLWLGFAFASDPAPPSGYFERSDFFDPGAELVGVHLDNVVVKAPAPTENIRVRPLEAPAPTPPGRTVATFAPGDPVTVTIEAANLGQDEETTQFDIRLANRTTGETEVDISVEPRVLAPGETVTIVAFFGTPPEGKYRIEAVAAAAEEGTIAPVLPTNSDASPDDNVAHEDVDVDTVHAVLYSDPAPTASDVPLQAPLAFTATAENHGNVPETVVLQAAVFDDETLENVTAELLPAAQRLQAAVLEAGEHHRFEWNLTTTVPGHYRLVVRTPDAAPFSPADVRPQPSDSISSGYVQSDADVTVDGELGDAAWADAEETSLELQGDSGTRAARLKMMNSDDHLYIGLVVRDATRDLPTIGDGDNLTLRFDDLADGISVRGSEDGIFYTEEGGTGATGPDLWRDLHYDVAGNDGLWPEDAVRDGAVVRTYQENDLGTVDDNEYVYEIRRPLGGPGDGGDLAAEPGSLLRFALNLTESTDETVTGAWAAPSDAALHDGEGLAYADGTLGDEMLTWRPIRLAAGPPPPPPSPTTFRAVTQAVGIDRSPPLVFLHDATQPVPFGQFTGVWSQRGGLAAGTAEERWQHGFYPDEGRSLFYMGATPDSVCNGGPCPPFAMLSDQAADEAVLTTPAIHVPEAGLPYLRFDHQFATGLATADCGNANYPCNRGQIAFLTGQVWVTADTLNPANGQWQETAVLRSDQTPLMTAPTGEQIARLWDPLFPLGREVASSPSAGVGNFCTTTGTTSSIITDHEGWPTCAWWWPTGRQILRTPGDHYASISTFSGSPWINERIPLVSNGHGEDGATPVDLRGQIVRFNFHYVHGSVAGGTANEGWRIGSVAVTPGPTLGRDVAVASFEFDTGYDPAEIGLGPGTRVKANVTIRNEGHLAVTPITVAVAAEDPATGQATVECEPASILVPLSPLEEQTVTVDCEVADVDGAAAALQVHAALAKDDLPVNNRLPAPLEYEIRRHLDAAVVADVSPRAAPMDVVRSVPLVIANRGNVPVSEVEVQREIHVVLGGLGSQLIRTDGWRLSLDLPPGEQVSLGHPSFTQAANADPPVEPTRDLFYQAATAGPHRYLARILATADANASNDVHIVPFEASNVIYAENLESPPQTAPGLVDGTRTSNGTHDVWSVEPGGFQESPRRLLAGDASSADLPDQTDSVLTLPKFDLTTVRSASLSFFHRYDLEESFDGGRVEMSVDGGETWQILQPRPDPLRGLPNGYPDVTLIGDTPLLDGAPEAHGVAYSGASADLPDAVGGWIPAEFDLKEAPAFQRPARLEAFSLDGFSQAAEGEPRILDGSAQWTHPSWTLPEPEATAGQRYWWIENRTYANPQPVSGSLHWWSGSRGSSSDRVFTNLTLPLALTETTGRDDESVVLQWLDWRDGWRDAWVVEGNRVVRGEPDATRRGTGGAFDVVVESSTGPQAVEPDPVAFRDDGWTRREVDVTPFLGQQIDVRFTWRSETSLVANRGWFVDDVELVSYQLVNGTRHAPVTLEAHDMEGLVSEPDGSAGPFDVERHEGSASDGIPYAQTAWRLSDAASGPAKPGGWHVDEDVTADGSETAVWRFSRPVTQEHRQGYPHSADARLVTPVMDLSKVAGQGATLRFEHKYGFESNPGFQRSGSSNSPGPAQAVDGGVVEFQVFDEATGTFGPWRPLYDEVPDQGVIWGEFGVAYVYSAGVDDLLGTGYPAVQFPTHGSGLPRYDGDLIRCCWHATEPFPLANVFSGTKEDWEEARFDLSALTGKKVRFAFHAWSNPFYGSSDPLHGWTVSDVAVEGNVFEGRPVELRLRVATDQSLNKGEWSIDDLSLVGDRYGRNVAVLGENETWHGLPGEEIALAGRVANLGTQGRQGLALRVVAHAANGTSVPLQVDASPPLPGLEGVDDAYGPFSLTPGGATGSSLPFRVLLTLPEEPQDVRVFVRLLEDRGVPEEDESGEIVHNPSYEEPQDEVLGNTRAEWVASGVTVRDIRLVPPNASRPSLLVADPMGSEVGEPITLTVRLQNGGTTTEDVELTWNFTSRETGQAERPEETQVVQDVKPGEARTVKTFWSPEEAGIFRARMTFRPPGDSQDWTETVDVPVGRSLAFFTDRFDEESAPGWDFERVAAEENPPRSPQWRVTDGRLLWGVTEEQFASGTTYCTNRPCQETGTGPEAWARTNPANPIDLRAVPGGQGSLILIHDYAFDPCDGGRVEVAIYDDPAVPSYRFTDAGSEEPGSPRWFPLEPEGGHPGRTCSEPADVEQPGGPDEDRLNPLGDNTPVFSGESGASLVTTFDLADQAVATIGERVAVRLHVGVQAGSNGGRGWAIDAVGIVAGRIEMGPDDEVGDLDADRQWPVLPGAPKRFFVTATNGGPADDLATFDLHPRSAVDASWVILPDPVPLAPGETRRIPVTIDVPPDPSLDLGTPPLFVRGSSAASPLASDELFLVLDLFRNPLPDLSAELRIEADGSSALEAGTVVPLHAVVRNFGDADSDPVAVVFEARPLGGVSSAIDRQALPSVCAQRDCGKQASTRVLSTDWIVPDAPGTYRLSVDIDPAGKLLEQSRTNNRHEFVVEVDRPERPDVAVVDLAVEGADESGFVEEGSFFALNATVANLGRATARNVQVLFFLGSGLLGEKTIAELGPGQSVRVHVTKAATAGEFLARVRAVSGSPLGDLLADNDEIARTVRVRGHDLQVTIAPDVPATSAGGMAVVDAEIHNGGNVVERLDATLADAPPGWTLAVRPDPLNVLPNRTTHAVFLLSPPKEEAAGVHELTVELTPAGAPHAAVTAVVKVEVESDEGSIEIIPDADVASGPGQVTLPVEVANQGNVAHDLVLRVVGGGDGSTPVSLAPFARAPINLSVDIPGTTPPGMHALRLALEAPGTGPVVAQVDAEVRVQAVQRAHASWANVSLRPSAPAEDPTENTAEFRLLTENAGNTLLNLSVRPRGFPPDAATLVEPTRLDLAPGENQTVLVTLLTATSFDARNVQIALVGFESQNDILVVALPSLPSLPNLVVTEFAPEAPTGIQAGVPAAFRVVVGNEGDAASPTTHVYFFVNGALAGRAAVPALDPGATFEANATLSLAAGSSLVVAAVDARRDVAELRTDDNGMGVDLEVEEGSILAHRVPSLSAGLVVIALGVAVLVAGRRRRL